MGYIATTLSVKPCAIPVHWWAAGKDGNMLVIPLHWKCWKTLKNWILAGDFDSYDLCCHSAQLKPLQWGAAKVGVTQLSRLYHSGQGLAQEPCRDPWQLLLKAWEPKALWKHCKPQLYQHKMALPCSCTTYIHQNPIHVTDKLPADRKAAKNPAAYHLLHRPNAPIRLGASSHSLLHLGKYFQWNMQTNQPWITSSSCCFLHAERWANQQRWAAAPIRISKMWVTTLVN